MLVFKISTAIGMVSRKNKSAISSELPDCAIDFSGAQETLKTVRH
jgi:hypothetical protein